MLKSQKRVLKKLKISYYCFGNVLLKIDLLGQFSSSSSENKVFSHLEKLHVVNSDEKWIKNKQYFIIEL